LVRQSSLQGVGKVRALPFDAYVLNKKIRRPYRVRPLTLVIGSSQGLPSSRLYPVTYLLALPSQRLEPGKHLSVPGEGRVVDIRRPPL